MQILVMGVNLFLISTKATFCGIPPMCCAGYKWRSENKSCIACDSGYFGINCNNKCIFPSYGNRCQLECRCKEFLCHHSTGCGRFGISTAQTIKILDSSTTSETKAMEEEQKTNKTVNISTTDAANNSATTAIGEEGMTNEEYLSRQEEKSRRKNMAIFLSTIGLSVIAVTLAFIYIILCFVDVDVGEKPEI